MNVFSKLYKRIFLLVGPCLLAVSVISAQAEITVALVPIGDANNLADSNGRGAVNYSYGIGKFDVTSGQYTAFLNAVATSSDSLGLYDSGMAPGGYAACGIAQTSVAAGFSYSVSSQDVNLPVTYVSWGDAARFCNWLSNKQPTGAEGVGTTETGSYSLNSPLGEEVLTSVVRNPGSEYTLPTEDEWYKAAYYDPSIHSYYSYPTRSNIGPINVASATGTNNANLYDRYGTGNGGYTDPVRLLTPVGEFSASPSSYGTYDQGGDVGQWNEMKWIGDQRGVQGGSFHDSSYALYANSNGSQNPSIDDYSIGFRIVQVPEPAPVLALGLGAMLVLARRSPVG